MPDPVARLNAALEGRYAIERKLGDGGMASVYLAGDSWTQTPCLRLPDHETIGRGGGAPR